MKFSLILATWKRTEEVRRLLESLANQSYQNFEVIMVDQNDDDRLGDLFVEYAQRFKLVRVKAPARGHAAANNVGLPLVSGDVVGLLDDDCWYPASVLSRLVERFSLHSDYGAVTGREASAERGFTNTRFDVRSGDVTIRNIWRRHISFTMFMRKGAIGGLRFDENIGTGSGSRWGAGEETDFLLRLMKTGSHVYYDSELVICHPDWSTAPLTPSSYQKANMYGLGMGRLLRIYRFPAAVVLKYMMRPAGGMVLYAAQGRFRRAHYCLAMLSGRLCGWLLSGGGPVDV